MLVWYHAASAADSSLRLQLFDVDALLPIDDPRAAATALSDSRRLFTLAQPLAAMEISTALSNGSHTIAVPDPLQGLGELLLLAPSTADGNSSKDHHGEMRETLWILDTGTGALEVTPQDWFNEGPYDFGYQWITRAARLTDTGQIVGEGIRLGVFVLDSSHRQISEWLVTDIFYHPEHA